MSLQPKNASSSTMSIANLNDSTQPLIITTEVIVISLAAVFVGLRFLSRWKRGLDYGSDDWIIIGALCLLFLLFSVCMNMITQGLGRHTGALSHSQIATFEKLLVAFQINYIIVLHTIKVSLLLMYIRIFPIRQMRLSAYILSGFSAAWAVSMICVSIFRCSPVKKAWNASVEGKCVNFRGAIIGNAVPNILSDVVILSLPMPLLWQLQTGLIQRIMLSGVFLLGSFVVFTSIYRFKTLLSYTPSDATWTLAPVFTWSIIEVSAGIISTCLPTLGPLINLPSITKAAKVLLTNTRGVARRVGEQVSSSARRREGTEMSSRARVEREREDRVDESDVGEGIRRPAFFKLKSGRMGVVKGLKAASGVGMSAVAGVGDRREGVGGDGSASVIERVVLDKNK